MTGKDRMIAFEPSVYIRGFGVKKLTQEEFEDFVGMAKGRRPITAVAQQFVGQTKL